MRAPLQSIRKRRYVELTLFLLFIVAYMLCVPSCAKRAPRGPSLARRDFTLANTVAAA